MRCLLLALCVALARGAQDIFVPQIGENLDVQKVAGPWYPVAMVASDAALMNAESAPMRLNIKELRPTAQDGLEITVRRWEDGSCVERKMFAEKTEAPASFQIHTRTPEADQAAKEQFNRAVKLLSTHTSIAFTPAQAEDRCRV
ncbi:progestagen associated endometrial protein [Phyllostomus discolor]|uniref:Progestagen associated endometrial protein n=1 Tax=Phyllostomus discolor TaxID=89673 RepID=A0A834EM95_9CHIR|nr:progestagen associated endometrial protein [Phyllostomus discolor]